MYSLLSVHAAVRKIQGLARRALLRAVRLSVCNLKKVTRIHTDASSRYTVLEEWEQRGGGGGREDGKGREEGEERKEGRGEGGWSGTGLLGPVINLAMSMQILDLEESRCEGVYKQALDLSGSSPLVCRAYAIFLISTCKAPVQRSRERALQHIAASTIIDERCTKFETALCMYEYACVLHPRDYRPFLNLALVDILIYRNMKRGEKMLRRALAFDPFNPRVMALWGYLESKFSDSKCLGYPLSRIAMAASGSVGVGGDNFEIKELHIGGKMRLLHGFLVVDNVGWAGWCYCSDQSNPHLIPNNKNNKNKNKIKNTNSFEMELEHSTNIDEIETNIDVDSDIHTADTTPSRGAIIPINENTDYSQLPCVIHTDYSIWYNPADGTKRTQKPNFKTQFEIRKQRSFFEKSKGGLENYFDPLTNSHFQYHPISDSYS